MLTNCLLTQTNKLRKFGGSGIRTDDLCFWLFLFMTYINSTLQYVLEEIFWADTPLLESVGEHEPRVEELRETILNAIQKALLPMMAYAKAYEKYLDLNNLEINDYIKWVYLHNISRMSVFRQLQLSGNYPIIYSAFHHSPKELITITNYTCYL